MPDIALPLTKDLLAALADINGGQLASADPLVVLAAWVDALAKEYGLSESLSLDGDPIERVQTSQPAMALVAHYLGVSAPAALDADTARARIYGAVAALSADISVRRLLNRNQPLTQSRVLYLAQIYWNLEASAERPLLPIKPDQGRDIPTPGGKGDFATMRWTARVNQKGEQKSSGQSFRTQGARLAVLVARQFMVNTEPAPEWHSKDLELHPTSDPQVPVEIGLADLAERSWSMGEYDDALDLSTAHLSMTQRRAEREPLVHEAELAGAYFLKGVVGVQPARDWVRPSRVEVRDFAITDLQKAAASLRMLVELDPANQKQLSDLIAAQVVLASALGACGRHAESLASAQDAATLSEQRLSAEPASLAQHLDVLLFVATVMADAGAHSDGASTLERAKRALSVLLEAEPTDPAHRDKAMSLFYSTTQNLQARGRPNDAVAAARDAVAFAIANQEVLADPARSLASAEVGLSNAFAEAGQLEDAVAAGDRALTLLEAMEDASPGDPQARRRLAAIRVMVGRLRRQLGEFEATLKYFLPALEAWGRLAADEPEDPNYPVAFQVAVEDAISVLLASGRGDDAKALGQLLRELDDEA